MDLFELAEHQNCKNCHLAGQKWELSSPKWAPCWRQLFSGKTNPNFLTKVGVILLIQYLMFYSGVIWPFS